MIIQAKDTDNCNEQNIDNIYENENVNDFVIKKSTKTAQTSTKATRTSFQRLVKDNFFK